MDQLYVPTTIGRSHELLKLLPKIGLQFHDETRALQAAGEGLPLGKGQAHVFTVDQVDTALAQDSSLTIVDRIAIKTALRNNLLLA